MAGLEDVLLDGDGDDAMRVGVSRRMTTDARL